MSLKKWMALSIGVLNVWSMSAHATDKESLRSAQLAHKIEVCGASSIEKDTLSNFSDAQSGWFGGQAKVLVDPHEAFLAKILLIQKAKVSIDVSTYIFSVDEVTNAFLSELSQAIRRGVNVRFMLDSGGSIGEAIKDRYSHLRTLLLVKKAAELEFNKDPRNRVKPGNVDVVIFHPIIRFRTITSHLDDRFIDHVGLSEETTINWDRRSHDKIFMIDKENPNDTLAIVGGRNFDKVYFGLPQVDEKTYEDMEVLLSNNTRGSVNIGTTLGQHYQNLFCSKGNRWLSLERFDASLDKGGFSSVEDLPTQHALKDLDQALSKIISKAQLKSTFDKMKGRSGFDFLTTDLQASQLLSANEIANLKRKFSEVVVNPETEFKDSLHNGNSIYGEIFKLISDAKRTIDICTPYVFVTKNERECLKYWAMQVPGRKLRVLSNSAATSDSALAMTTFDKTTAPELMRSGPYECHLKETINGKSVEKTERGIFDNRDHKISAYELGRLDNKMFRGEIIKGQVAEGTAIYGKLHAKFGIIDGQYSFVGSDNLDARSRHLNSETAFFIDNTKIASDLTLAFDHLVQRSYIFDDPDLQVMLGTTAVQKRVKSMKALDKVFKAIPQSAFAN